jgi:peptide/nickel transport system substrate-binding protein
MKNLKKPCILIMFVFAVIFCFSAITAAQETSVIKVVMGAGVNDWDPAIAFSNESQLLDNIYERLLLLDLSEGEKFIPVLATSYQRSEDGKIWTFTLRQGVKFHNGEPFNAEAVKFSIDRIKTMGKGPAWIWDPVEEIKVLDEFTVQFICKNPAPIDLIAASQYGSYMIPPKLYADKTTEWFQTGKAVGTGPYKLVSWEKGVQTITERFDDYWGGWKPNQFDKAIFKDVTEVSTRIQLIKQGGVDAVFGIPSDMLPGLRKDPNLNVMHGPSLYNTMYHLHCQKPPTDDINVRRAFYHAINFDELVATIYQDTGTKAVGPLPASIWSHDPNLKLYEYNVDKAKELLKKSKYADQLSKGPMKITMVNYYRPADTTALYIQAALKKIGFEIDIDKTPWPAVWDRYKSKEACSNISLMNWWPTYVTPGDWFKSMWYTEKEPLWNFSYWYNSEFDKLVDKAIASEAADRQKAIAIYQKLQQWLVDEAVSLFVVDSKSQMITRKIVQGLKMYPAYPGVVFVHELTYQK